MRIIGSLFRLQIAAGGIDALLLRLAQIVCFIVAIFVLVAGVLRVTRLDLAEAQLFAAIQQLAQTALLFCILGLLLHPKSNAGF